MFERNDKSLLIARIVLFITFCFNVILSLVIGILMAVKLYWAFIFLIFAGWISSWMLWLFERLILSFFCDIKLIRNRLYRQENTNLEVFFQEREKIKIIEPTIEAGVEENSESEQSQQNISANDENNINFPIEPKTDTLDKDSVENEIKNDVNKQKLNKKLKGAIISVIIFSALSLISVAIVLFLNFYNSYF